MIKTNQPPQNPGRFIDPIRRVLFRIEERLDVAQPGAKVNLVDGDYDVINIGGSNPVHLVQYIKMLEEQIGKKAKLIPTPKQKGDVNQTYADTSQLYAEIGTVPSKTLQKGLVTLVESVREYYGYQQMLNHGS
jgi:nucleoside-diphosphate-sugar epimerase